MRWLLHSFAASASGKDFIWQRHTTQIEGSNERPNNLEAKVSSNSGETEKGAERDNRSRMRGMIGPPAHLASSYAQGYCGCEISDIVLRISPVYKIKVVWFSPWVTSRPSFTEHLIEKFALQRIELFGWISKLNSWFGQGRRGSAAFTLWPYRGMSFCQKARRGLVDHRRRFPLWWQINWYFGLAWRKCRTIPVWQGFMIKSKKVVFKLTK